MAYAAVHCITLHCIAIHTLHAIALEANTTQLHKIELFFVSCRSDGSAFSKLSKAVRHEILYGVAFDVDQRKAGASILLALASKYGIQQNCLKHWVQDETSEISNVIMGEMGATSVDQVKLAVNVALYSATAPCDSGRYLCQLHKQVRHT